VIDPGFFAMDSTFNEVCILVTAAFALTLVPCFRNPKRSLLSRRDQETALLVFTVLGLIEDATGPHTGLLNERIVAVCAVGPVAGPWVERRQEARFKNSKAFRR
jgi:LytS/YehU family sensor histidine kinase